MDSWMDRWTVRHDSKNGQEIMVGQQGQVGQVRRVETRWEDMNAARGRCPKNARSTEIRRSIDKASVRFLNHIPKFGS